MRKEQQQFKAGMYLLETLTSGMYNEPLSIYREYIQNCVDSIDVARRENNRDFKINIRLDPFDRIITIHDNGTGIPSSVAERVLSSIGSSDKIGTDLRGFRGIGRLGGIAFAQKAIFRTKACGENKVSEQTWDCGKLRNLLDAPGKSPLSLEEVFTKVTAFRKIKSNTPEDDSFFEVVLEGVESYRNQIFDITKIKKYISQVAPLPFDPDLFGPFGDEISAYLFCNVKQYGEYHIMINDMPIYRPYKKEFSVTNKGSSDCINGFDLVELKANGKTLAYGWLGRRRDFLGSISKGEGISGIRIKAGNIMIGNEHLLDPFFREDRFNSYTMGELHIVDNDLIPNSRRDDFVDTPTKNLLFNAIEREIGLPVSKEIRLRSKLKSEIKNNNLDTDQTITTQPPILSSKSLNNDDGRGKSSNTISKVERDGIPDLFSGMSKKCLEKKCPIFLEVISNSSL